MATDDVELNEIIARLKTIKAMGYVESHRCGDTGIGKTLEDLLGITENNIAGPDLAGYEVKCARKGSSSMLTLFTKVPMPKGVNRTLLDILGYVRRDLKTGNIQPIFENGTLIVPNSSVDPKDKELHVTVDALKTNSVGLKLRVKGNVVEIENGKGISAYYDEAYLKAAFEKKYKHELLYILADSKRVEGAEQFWFNEAYLLSGFSYENFSKAVAEGVIKLDIRIGHYPNGRPHDHGTGFRVFPRALPKCFAKIESIL